MHVCVQAKIFFPELVLCVMKVFLFQWEIISEESCCIFQCVKNYAEDLLLPWNFHLKCLMVGDFSFSNCFMCKQVLFFITCI